MFLYVVLYVGQVEIVKFFIEWGVDILNLDINKIGFFKMFVVEYGFFDVFGMFCNYIFDGVKSFFMKNVVVILILVVFCIDVDVFFCYL